MAFSTCCHSSLSNIIGCSFSCAFKAHLLSTGWISICYYCCFTKQWMRFSTCCHCPLSKNSLFGSRFIFTVHVISSGWFQLCFHCVPSDISGPSFSCYVRALSLSTGWISICCQCCSTKQWMRFSTCHCPLSKSSGWCSILSL